MGFDERFFEGFEVESGFFGLSIEWIFKVGVEEWLTVDESESVLESGIDFVLPEFVFVSSSGVVFLSCARRDTEGSFVAVIMFSFFGQLQGVSERVIFESFA